MIHIDSVRIALPLKKKFTTSKGEASVKTNLLAILNNRYIGEASGSVHYGPAVEELEADLTTGMEQLRTIERIDLDTLEAIGQLEINPTSKSALIGAALNSISGETRRYPWELLSLGSPVGIKSSFTITIDNAAEMERAINGCEYPIIKIKMGNEQDILLLDVLKRAKERTIRVDANGGWSCAKAEEMIHHLAQRNVTVIEQPTDIEYISEWPHLKKGSDKVELIVDEGLNSVADYEKYASYIDGANIKMEKCGGIVEAMKIAARASADGKKIMLGCMVESSVGIAQSVYMSSMADYFDLDGPLLLESDIARGILYDRESIAVDREIIGGPKLKREILQKYIQD
ncbi:MAG: enolase C-terminal domain-like protein [bacterium]|nr:enolase C-terminal domain-like protein [bacterium]